MAVDPNEGPAPMLRTASEIAALALFLSTVALWAAILASL